MTEKQLSNEEIVEEIIRLQKQTGRIIKATYVVLIFTLIAYIILILLRLGVI